MTPDEPVKPKTLLDLARAFAKAGDDVSARRLLREVIESGAPSEQVQAR